MISRAINYLGFRAKDKITGAKGIVTSVVFDLYGCVQVCLHTGLDKDGKPREQSWYDIARMEIKDDADRVMPVPAAFHDEDQAPSGYEKGAADKPAPHSQG